MFSGGALRVFLENPSSESRTPRNLMHRGDDGGRVYVGELLEELLDGSSAAAVR